MLLPRLFLLAAATFAGCNCGARPDDALEPNDDLTRATPLTPGEPVEARANQGNPDVFSVDAPEGRTLVFTAESRGLENCPAFTVHGPGAEVLYEDTHDFCDRGPEEPRKAPGVELELLDVKGYEIGGYALRIPTTQAGRYFLTIVEQGRVDNAAPFSWDYRLTARVE